MRLRDWSQIRINCLGDSTTWGDDGSHAPSATCGPAVSWPTHLGELLGAAEVRNYGVKGSAVALDPLRDDSLIERMPGMDADAQVVLVMGGVNDFNFSHPLGKLASSDPCTFYGATDVLARGLVARYPAADIVFVTSAKTGGVASEGLPAFWERNSCGHVQGDYARAFCDVAGRYGLPIIDLFAESGMTPLVDTHKPRFMPDGLHFSPEGYERLARRIASGLLRVAAF